MKYFKLIFFIAVVVTLSGCSRGEGASEKKTDDSAKAASLETITLGKEALFAEMTIPGELIANQQVDIYAKVTGFVKEMKVDIGSKVRTGQVLIVLEAPEMAAQLSAAESRLKSQEATYAASIANYNRLVETSKTPGTISQNDLEQAEARKNADIANLEAAKASYKEVNDLKDYLTIRAPFSGVISARNINVGAYAGPSGGPALTLQQQDKLRLVVSIPEAYTGYLKQNAEVQFRVRAIPSQTFKANLIRFSGALDEAFRSQRVEADIQNTDGKFLAGTVADVTLKMQSAKESFAIPNSSIVTTAQGSFVIRVVDNKTQRVKIKTGLRFEGSTEVFGSLSTGDVLLKKGNDEIKDGTEVK